MSPSTVIEFGTFVAAVMSIVRGSPSKSVSSDKTAAEFILPSRVVLTASSRVVAVPTELRSTLLPRLPVSFNSVKSPVAVTVGSTLSTINVPVLSVVLTVTTVAATEASTPVNSFKDDAIAEATAKLLIISLAFKIIEWVSEIPFKVYVTSACPLSGVFKIVMILVLFPIVTTVVPSPVIVFPSTWAEDSSKTVVPLTVTDRFPRSAFGLSTTISVLSTIADAEIVSAMPERSKGSSLSKSTIRFPTPSTTLATKLSVEAGSTE